MGSYPALLMALWPNRRSQELGRGAWFLNGSFKRGGTACVLP